MAAKGSSMDYETCLETGVWPNGAVAAMEVAVKAARSLPGYDDMSREPLDVALAAFAQALWDNETGEYGDAYYNKIASHIREFSHAQGSE